jgi:magnesium transporter
MTAEHETQPWVKLEAIIESGDAEQLEAYIHSLAPGDAALALSRLDGEEQLKVLTILEPQDAADLIDEIPDVQATALVDALSPAQAAVILQNLDSGPILTTVTDMCGFFFVLSFAQLMLPWLVGTT